MTRHFGNKFSRARFQRLWALHPKGPSVQTIRLAHNIKNELGNWLTESSKRVTYANVAINACQTYLQTSKHDIACWVPWNGAKNHLGKSCCVSAPKITATFHVWKFLTQSTYEKIAVLARKTYLPPSNFANVAHKLHMPSCYIGSLYIPATFEARLCMPDTWEASFFFKVATWITKKRKAPLLTSKA